VNPPNEQEAAEASKAARLRKGQQLPLVQRVGLLAVRGAEVVEARDEEGGLMNDFTGRVRLDERKPPKGKHCCACECLWKGWERSCVLLWLLQLMRRGAL
jgi:hypothetical protein